MDVPALAANVVTYLGPFLPYLVKAGGKAAEEVGKKLGVDALDRAKTLWGKLRGNKEVEEAGQDAAEMPDDADAQAAFRLQLKKALTQDAALAEEVERLMESKVVQRVLAERGSEIRRVQLSARGGGDSRQEVVARDQGVIEDVQIHKE